MFGHQPLQVQRIGTFRSGFNNHSTVSSSTVQKCLPSPQRHPKLLFGRSTTTPPFLSMSEHKSCEVYPTKPNDAQHVNGHSVKAKTLSKLPFTFDAIKPGARITAVTSVSNGHTRQRLTCLAGVGGLHNPQPSLVWAATEKPHPRKTRTRSRLNCVIGPNCTLHFTDRP